MKNLGHFFQVETDIRLHYQIYMPSEKLRGTIFIFHGLCEHLGRYQKLIKELLPLGLQVIVFDLRGHGLSMGPRTHINSFQDYIEDCRIIYEEIVEPRIRRKPVFLLAHSMGAILALNYLQKYQYDFKGCVLSGIGASAQQQNPLLSLLSPLVSLLLPKMRINFPFPPEVISSSDEVIEDYIADKLVEKNLTVRLGREIMINHRRGVKKAGLIDIPLLLQNGTADKTFYNFDKLFEAFGANDKTHCTYEGLEHELYTEVTAKRKMVMKDLTQWLSKRII